MGWIQRSELEEVAKASEGKPIKAACSTLCSFGALWRLVLYNQVVKWLPHPPAKASQVCDCLPKPTVAGSTTELPSVQLSVQMFPHHSCTVQCSGVDYAQG